MTFRVKYKTTFVIVDIDGATDVISTIRDLEQTYPDAVDIERYRLSDFQQLNVHYSYSD